MNEVTSRHQVVVMKFGGTSVATEHGRAAVARKVGAYLEQGIAPVLVVSAMGRIGEPYATDTLLALVDGCPPSERERDLLASVGETISAIVMAHELRRNGYPAAALSGAEAGIVASDRFGAGVIEEICTDLLSEVVAAGVVPVVCGFQGVTAEGHVVTLGRGGSDTTACALGVALDAQAVEIYTDVDGVMTADPRVVSGARVLETIRADELAQMARMGSKVVHAPAAVLALESGVPLLVRNTFTSHCGTQVVPIQAVLPSALATAVASTPDVVRYSVDLGADEGSVTHMAAQTSVYESLAEAGVSLDMFTPADSRLYFTVSGRDTLQASTVLSELGLRYEANGDLAKVTVVGAGMHGVPGVMARVSRSLLDAGIDVMQAADSHVTISVLVESESADDAVRALHAGFGLSDAQ